MIYLLHYLFMTQTKVNGEAVIERWTAGFKPENAAFI